MEEKYKELLIEIKEVLDRHKWISECVDSEQGWYEEYPREDIMEVLAKIEALGL